MLLGGWPGAGAAVLFVVHSVLYEWCNLPSIALTAVVILLTGHVGACGGGPGLVMLVSG